MVDQKLVLLIIFILSIGLYTYGNNMGTKLPSVLQIVFSLIVASILYIGVSKKKLILVFISLACLVFMTSSAVLRVESTDWQYLSAVRTTAITGEYPLDPTYGSSVPTFNKYLPEFVIGNIFHILHITHPMTIFIINACTIFSLSCLSFVIIQLILEKYTTDKRAFAGSAIGAILFIKWTFGAGFSYPFGLIFILLALLCFVRNESLLFLIFIVLSFISNLQFAIWLLVGLVPFSLYRLYYYRIKNNNDGFKFPVIESLFSVIIIGLIGAFFYVGSGSFSISDPSFIVKTYLSDYILQNALLTLLWFLAILMAFLIMFVVTRENIGGHEKLFFFVVSAIIFYGFGLTIFDDYIPVLTTQSWLFYRPINFAITLIVVFLLPLVLKDNLQEILVVLLFLSMFSPILIQSMWILESTNLNNSSGAIYYYEHKEFKYLTTYQGLYVAERAYGGEKMVCADIRISHLLPFWSNVFPVAVERDRIWGGTSAFQEERERLYAEKCFDTVRLPT